MKNLLLSLVVLFSFSSNAQEGFHLGIEASPSWHLNIQRQVSTTLLSNTNGYGFTLGVPVKYGFSESMAFQTGLSFEMMLFDQRFNGNLISSNRHGSIHVPLQLSYVLTGDWNFIFGTGFNYNLINNQWTQFGNINIGIAVNKFQPYAAAGISTIMERGPGIFELGMVGRYHFIDLYNGETTFMDDDFKNWIFSADLVLRYYLFNP
jgi:hypothetical protein